MSRLQKYFSDLRQKWALTPEQAEAIASIKFPCC